jgi:hypothetical protein
MKIRVDIDETICFYESTRDYPLAKPYKNKILEINRLYDEGHEITYWTARGSTTGIDWFDLTEKQLKAWGCKYHDLNVGEKPYYDLLICDKAVNSESFFKSRGVNVK